MEHGELIALGMFPRVIFLMHWKKQFAKKILPDEIINRQKKGFKSPTEHWFRKEPDRINEILLSEKSMFIKRSMRSLNSRANMVEIIAKNTIYYSVLL